MMKTRPPAPSFSDPRYHSVIGFFAAKGLLYAPQVKPRRSENLRIKDVIWVGENLEPRVFEVLPAAILHFPRSFSGGGKLPRDLQEVMHALAQGVKEHPDCRGIPYQKIKHWAERALPDKRTTPLSRRKVMRSYRLSPETARLIKEQAAKRKMSEAGYLEMLVREGKEP
jgi:hypothetical protein